MLALMQVHLAPTVDQRHAEVNNSVGVQAGRLSPRYELIYIALWNDRGRDGEARGMEGEIKEWVDGGLEGRGEGRRKEEVIEEPRPDGRLSPICTRGKSTNIERWMIGRFVCV